MESDVLEVGAPSTAALNPIRVLFVIPQSESANAMVFAQQQIAALEVAGIEGRKFWLASRTSPKVLAFEFSRLRREVQRFRPNLIHAQFGTMTAFFSAAAANCPLIVTFRGSDLNPSPGVPWGRAFLGKLLSQLASIRANRIVCVSDQLMGRLWFWPSRVSIIPSGVDEDLFSPGSRDEARNELHWNMEERVVLFNASCNPRLKRLDLAERAVEAARKICGEIRFVVLRGEVESKRIALFMNAADCLLCTSYYEGSPNIVKEALACNLPVVSVAVGDVPVRLRGVSPSSIVEPDPLLLADELVRILALRERSNGREAIRDISLKSTTSKLLRLYRSVATASVGDNISPSL